MSKSTITIAYFTPAFDLATASASAASLYRDFWRELGQSFAANVMEVSPDANVDELVCSLRAKPVVAHPNGKVPLHQFRHPRGRAIYLFGPEDRRMDSDVLTRFQSVRIPTPTTHPLWGPIAAGVVLQDRRKR